MLKCYEQSSLARHNHPKLAPRFVGPYEIVNRVGQVAYKLALPPSSHSPCFS